MKKSGSQKKNIDKKSEKKKIKARGKEIRSSDYSFIGPEVASMNNDWIDKDELKD